MLESRLGQRSPAQIRMQNHARSIDHRTQRILGRAPHLLLNSVGNPRKRKLQRSFVEQSGSDLFPQPRQHRPRRIGHRSRSVTGRKRSHARRAHQFIHRRQFAKEF